MDITISKQERQKGQYFNRSKSITQRVILSAFISKGTTKIINPCFCDDTYNTINILRELTEVKIENNSLFIKGYGFKTKFTKKHYFIDEALSTYNFLFPILSYYSKDKFTIHFGERLEERVKNEIDFENFEIKNKYYVSTKITSQKVSGLLFLLATLEGKYEIEIDSYNSISYIDETIDVLNEFGANIKRENLNIFVMHNQMNSKNEYEIPFDGTDALMNVAENVVFGIKENKQLSFNKYDSDGILANKLFEANCDPNALGDEIDISNNPDSIFALSTIALYKKSPTRIYGIDRLKNKETDRCFTLGEFFIRNNIEFNHKNNFIIYPLKKEPKSNLYNGLMCYGIKDHRAIKMAIVLSKKYGGFIRNVECLEKSEHNYLINHETKFEEITIEYFKCETKEECCSIECKCSKIENMILESTISSEAKYVVVTDNNVSKLFLDKVMKAFKTTRFYVCENEGEDIKTNEEYLKLVNYLIENKFSKTDYIVALGGGCITDFAGYTAMTYKRGIKLINIPTSLVGMVDASIGFKVALNVGKEKNMLGGFFVPERVLINPRFLETLSDKDIKNGLIEMIKIFALRSPKYFFKVFNSENNKIPFEWILETIKLKVKIVNEDPYDKDLRHILNFGHTIAHAIELKEGLSHGEAVGIGMMNNTSSILLKECLKKYGIEEKNINNIDYFNDKKIENGKLKEIFVDEIGTYRIEEIDI